MNFKQLLLGVFILGLLTAVAVAFVAPKAKDAMYGGSSTNDKTSFVSYDEKEDINDEWEDEDVWKGNEKHENETEKNQPTVIVDSQTEASASTDDYTLAQVMLHSNEDDCWTAIHGKIYDVTAFFGVHPGGDRNLFRVCGIDATAAFERKHGGDEKPEETLGGFSIGDLIE